MKKIDVAIVGAGPAGIGISAMLKDLGVTSQVVLEKNKVGDSFDKWPKEMRLITPSFTTNFYGHLDLNAIDVDGDTEFTYTVTNSNSSLINSTFLVL